MERLLSKDDLGEDESRKLRMIMSAFDKVPEVAAPTVYGRYRELRLRYADGLKRLGII